MTTNRVTIPHLLNPSPVLVNELDFQYYAVPKNGRYYHAWKSGKYPFPCDMAIRDCENILNGAIYLSCHGGHLDDVVLGPLLTNNGPIRKILDKGCGSGCWVSDTAKRFPDATVFGLDIVEYGYSYVPNAIWKVPNSIHGPALDFEDDLSSLGPASFDYIRMAHLHGAVADEGDLLRKAFDLAVPGTGTVEFTFVDWTFRTAGPVPLPTSGPLSRLQQLLALASRHRGIALNPDPNKIAALLTSVGFTDRIHRTHTLPLLPWSRDVPQFRAGELMETFLMCPRPIRPCNCFLRGSCLELLTRWLGMRPEEVDDLVHECLQHLNCYEQKMLVEAHCFVVRRPGIQYNPVADWDDALHYQ